MEKERVTLRSSFKVIIQSARLPMSMERKKRDEEAKKMQMNHFLFAV
jgi:hypothetical protein